MHRFIFMLMLAVSTPAISQTANPPCMGVADQLAGLAATFGEHPRIAALMTGGGALIITAAPGGGWTALVVQPDGSACMVASGEGFTVVDAPPEGDPA